MSINKFVHTGPPLYGPLNHDSIGIQIYNSLAVNDNKREAFVDAITNEKLSYSKLMEISCRLAESLKNAGYKANDVISICSENSLKFFHPVLAALYLGIIVAPINQSYIEDELRHILNISKPKVVFCSKMVMNKFINMKKKLNFIDRIIVLDIDEPISGVETLNGFMNDNSDKYFDEYRFKPVMLDSKSHVAAVLCSSGTTGLPKGVMTTHENISFRFNHATDPRLHEKRSNMAKLGFLPFFHGYGFMTTLGSIIMGELVVVLSKFDEKAFLQSIQDYKITDLWLVPPILIFLAKSPLVEKYDLSSIKEIASGAAPLSKETEELVKKRLNINFIRQGYGLTECTLAVIMMPLGDERAGCSGKIVPGMSVKLRDPETGETLGPNKPGELCIKGKLVMAGYMNNPKANKESFTDDGWLLTGDVAYYDENGYFYIVDRIKELIKYKGFQVAPAELEALLLTFPKIRDAGVVGIPNEEAGELPLAFVVKQPGVDVTEKEIQDFVAGKVSNAKRLRGGVKFLDQIPKNPSGKILRKELRILVKIFNSKL